MSPGSTLEQRISHLFEKRQFAIKLGLDTELRLCEALGNPQHRMAIVHVAGTNGKGSTCAMIESILRASGLRTGLYTSPHLCALNERFRINGTCVDDARLATSLDRVDVATREAHLTGDSEPTFFEVTTALAFDLFHRADVQVAVIETGLGGRLDATNVVHPLLSVITPIALDHKEHLGNDISTIAMEKCGIIKQGRPVISAPQTTEAAAVIADTADACGSRLVQVEDAVTVQVKRADLDEQTITFETSTGLGGTARLPLAGAHQGLNLATAIAAADSAAALINIDCDAESITSGIQSLQWPGRLSRVRDTPPLYLDAAHNPAGARALATALTRYAAGPVGLIMGMCGDKDTDTTLNILATTANRVWLVPVDNERGADPSALASTVRHQDLTVCNTLTQGLNSARAWAEQNNGIVCVCGSIFLVGDAYKALNMAPYGTPSSV